jgi:proteic killer suppression protein
VIAGFGNRLAEDLWDDKSSRAVRRVPPELRRAARRKLFDLNDAKQLKNLRAPPGNRLEALKGAWSGDHSIRIDDRWRVVFRWKNGQASDISVRVLDYH